MCLKNFFEKIILILNKILILNNVTYSSSCFLVDVSTDRKKGKLKVKRENSPSLSAENRIKEKKKKKNNKKSRNGSHTTPFRNPFLESRGSLDSQQTLLHTAGGGEREKKFKMFEEGVAAPPREVPAGVVSLRNRWKRVLRPCHAPFHARPPICATSHRRDRLDRVRGYVCRKKR